MKHYVKAKCKHGCRFLMITPSLWLCPHVAFGEASYLKGAEVEARALLERAGGYNAVLARVVADEQARRERTKKAPTA